MTDNFRVAGFVTGLAIKAPCNTFSLVNVPTPTGLGANIGGYIVGLYDRVLLTAQTNPVDNGIYSVRESAWVRDGDADGNRDFVGGTIVPVWTQGLASVVLWILGGDADQKTIGLDALTFTVYYDQSAILPEIDTLQTVTTRGNATVDEIIVNRTSGQQGVIITTGAQLQLQNSTDDGFLRVGHSASTTFFIGATGVSDGIQFTGFTNYIRFLGDSGGTGPVLVLEERAAKVASVATLHQIWVSSVPNPGELIFTNDDDQDINLTTELWDNGTRQVLSNSLGAAVRNTLFIGDDDNGFGSGSGSLYIAEKVNASVDFPTQGQFWVRDDAPGQTPMWTGGDGVDHVLNGSGGVSGAKAYGSVNHSILTTTVTPAIFNAEAYDTATIHDNAVNNTRLTVPAGVTRIRLTGYVRWTANGSAMRQMAIRKNGAGGTIDDDMTGYEPSVYMSAAGASAEEHGMNIDSGIIRAVATDYFELMVEQTSGLSLNLLAGDHWFQMDIIE